MKSPGQEWEDREDATIRDEAALWVVRHDRKLSRAEARDFEAWLAADPRHAEGFRQAVASWRQFRQVGAAVRRSESPAPLRRERRFWAIAGGLAAAATIAFLGGYWRLQPERQGNPAIVATARDLSAISMMRLSDGSRVQLQTNTEVYEEFSLSERRVRLSRGVAFFDVAKDEKRPFLVMVGGASVRAVGTAFSIDARMEAVNVLVTEGTVRITALSAASDSIAAGSELVHAGHRALIARKASSDAPAIHVTTVSHTEIARELAWRGQMLDLAGATLAELAAEFSRQSGRQVTIADASLGRVRIGGQFPTEDVEGFFRAIEQVYAVQAEYRSDGSIVLRGR